MTLLNYLLLPDAAGQLIYRRLLYVLLVIGLFIAMIPTSYIDTGLEVSDKVQHATAFFGFAVLLGSFSRRPFWSFQLPILLGYGLLVEVLQSLVSWRTFSLLDLLADLVGLLLYWLIIRQLILPWLQANQKPPNGQYPV